MILPVSYYTRKKKSTSIGLYDIIYMIGDEVVKCPWKQIYLVYHGIQSIYFKCMKHFIILLKFNTFDAVIEI